MHWNWILISPQNFYSFLFWCAQYKYWILTKDLYCFNVKLCKTRHRHSFLRKCALEIHEQNLTWCERGSWIVASRNTCSKLLYLYFRQQFNLIWNVSIQKWHELFTQPKYIINDKYIISYSMVLFYENSEIFLNLM